MVTQSVGQLLSKSVNQSVSQLVRQLGSQSISQLVSQKISQTVNQLVSLSVGQPVNELNGPLWKLGSCLIYAPLGQNSDGHINQHLVDILVNILTETQPICWSIYRLIYRVTCWPTYQPAISQYFASIAVDTRSIRWPLNVSGILVDCQWYIDWLSYNTRCFRVFLKASSILETSSMEVLQTLRSDSVDIHEIVAEK